MRNVVNPMMEYHANKVIQGLQTKFGDHHYDEMPLDGRDISHFDSQQIKLGIELGKGHKPMRSGGNIANNGNNKKKKTKKKKKKKKGD